MNTKNIVLIACAIAVLGLGASVVFKLLTIEQFGIISLAVIGALYGLIRKFDGEIESIKKMNESLNWDLKRYELSLDNEVLKSTKLNSEIKRLERIDRERSVSFNNLKRERDNLNKNNKEKQEELNKLLLSPIYIKSEEEVITEEEVEEDIKPSKNKRRKNNN